LVRAETAAQLLDMSEAEFRRLVDDGALPPADSLERSEVAKLEAIMRGDAVRPRGDIEL
jgi:hypothetical protein